MKGQCFCDCVSSKVSRLGWATCHASSACALLLLCVCSCCKCTPHTNQVQPHNDMHRLLCLGPCDQHNSCLKCWFLSHLTLTKELSASCPLEGVPAEPAACDER